MSKHNPVVYTPGIFFTYLVSSSLFSTLQCPPLTGVDRVLVNLKCPINILANVFSAIQNHFSLIWNKAVSFQVYVPSQ